MEKDERKSSSSGASRTGKALVLLARYVAKTVLTVIITMYFALFAINIVNHEIHSGKSL